MRTALLTQGVIDALVRAIEVPRSGIRITIECLGGFFSGMASGGLNRVKREGRPVTSDQAVCKKKVETSFTSIPLKKLPVVDLSFIATNCWLLYRGRSSRMTR